MYYPYIKYINWKGTDVICTNDIRHHKKRKRHKRRQMSEARKEELLKIHHIKYKLIVNKDKKAIMNKLIDSKNEFAQTCKDNYFNNFSLKSAMSTKQKFKSIPHSTTQNTYTINTAPLSPSKANDEIILDGLGPNI